MTAVGLKFSPSLKLDIKKHDESSLHGLKYHQLLKMSSLYNINKRYAKKNDLIQSLLSLKTKMCTDDKENELTNSEEWRDGAEVVNELKARPPVITLDGMSSRGTFIVDKNELNDSRATYNLTKTAFPSLNAKPIDSRLTFDVPPKIDNMPMARKIPKTANSMTLTVPMSMRNVPRGGRKVSSIKESPLKLSDRSLSIRKAKDVVLSPMKSARRSTVTSRQSINKTPSRMPPKSETPLPTKLSMPQVKLPPTITATSGRRKSKSDDPSASKRLGPVAKFLSPQAKTSKKPLTASKMPNFAAIHQRQFEKMDSLDAYMNKKSDRVKKLFGTPTTYKPPPKVVAEHPPPVRAKPASTLSNQHMHKTPVKRTLETAKLLINKNPHLRTRTDVKDKNRSHIHGVRSNKRFELQMKMRNV